MVPGLRDATWTATLVYLWANIAFQTFAYTFNLHPSSRNINIRVNLFLHFTFFNLLVRGSVRSYGMMHGREGELYLQFSIDMT